MVCCNSSPYTDQLPETFSGRGAQGNSRNLLKGKAGKTVPYIKMAKERLNLVKVGKESRLQMGKPAWDDHNILEISGK